MEPRAVMRRTHRVELPLSQPLSTRTGVITARQGVVLESRRGGVVALAEVSPHPDLSEIGAEGAYAAIGPWVPRDETPTNDEAAAGVEWVRLDHDARSASKPVAELLAGEPNHRVPLNGLIGLAGGAETATALAGLGYRTLKVKVGRDVARESVRVRQVFDAVGREVALRVDAGGSWDPTTLEDMTAAMEGVPIEYIEDPIEHSADWGSLANCPIPLALDANEPTDGQLDVIEVLVIKPSLIGPHGAMALATRAKDHGVDVVVTSIIDGAIGVAAASQVAAALGLVRACGLATSQLLTRDVAEPPPIQDGNMLVSGPGIGVTLSEDLLARTVVPRFSAPPTG